MDQSSPQWADLRELAKKFALSLGLDATKVRLPLVGIHRQVNKNRLARSSQRRCSLLWYNQSSISRLSFLSSMLTVSVDC